MFETSNKVREKTSNKANHKKKERKKTQTHIIWNKKEGDITDRENCLYYWSAQHSVNKLEDLNVINAFLGKCNLSKLITVKVTNWK